METVKIPVEFEVVTKSLENIKNIMNQLQPNSKSYKELGKEYSSILKIAEKLQFALQRGFSSKNEVTQFEKQIRDLETRLLSLQENGLKNLTFGELKLSPENESQLNQLESKLKEAKTKYDAAVNAFNSGEAGKAIKLFDKDLTKKSFDEINTIVSDAIKKFQQQSNEAKKLQENMSKTMDQMTNPKSTKKFDQKGDVMKSMLGDQFNNFFFQKNGRFSFRTDGAPGQYRQQFSDMILSTFNFNSDIGKDIADQLQKAVSAADFEKIFKDNTNFFSNLNFSDKIMQAFNVAPNLSPLLSDLNNAQSAFASASGAVDQFKAATLNSQNPVSLLAASIQAIIQLLPQLTQGATGAGNALDKMTQTSKMANDLKMLASRFLSVYQIINYIKRGFKEMMTTIKELDSVMTGISVVTNLSKSDLWGSIDQYSDLAQKYGTTIKGAYEVSKIYYQQGLETNDVMTLTEETLKLAKISGLDYADATDYMTTALRGFKMEMTEASRVVDVYSALAANTAVSQEELAEAMTRTASSLQSVGSTFEEASAMISTIVAVTRETASNVGSAMKSIASRYGELTKNPALLTDSEGEAVSFNKVDEALRSVGITMQTEEHQFRSFTDVVLELSEVWDTLSSTQQRYIATQFAGNRQQSRFLALVSNKDLLKANLEVAENSEDTGSIQALKTLDDINTKITQVTTAWQQFYLDVGIEDTWKNLLTWVTNILNSLNDMPKVFGKFPVAAISIISNIIMLVKTAINNAINSFASVLTNAMSNVGDNAGNSFRSRFVGKVKQAYNDAITEGMTAGQKIKAGISAGLTGIRSEISTIASTIAAAFQTFALSTNDGTFEGEQRSGFLNLGAGILQLVAAGASFYTQQYGIGTAMLASSASSIWTAIDQLTETTEEKAERLEKIAETLNTTAKESKQETQTVTNLIKKYDQLKYKQFESEESAQEYQETINSLAESFPELIIGFDDAGNAIIETTKLEEKLTESRKESAKAALEAAKGEVEAKEARLKSSIEEFSKIQTEENIRSVRVAGEYRFGEGNAEDWDRQSSVLDILNRHQDDIGGLTIAATLNDETLLKNSLLTLQTLLQSENDESPVIQSLNNIRTLNPDTLDWQNAVKDLLRTDFLGQAYTFFKEQEYTDEDEAKQLLGVLESFQLDDSLEKQVSDSYVNVLKIINDKNASVEDIYTYLTAFSDKYEDLLNTMPGSPLVNEYKQLYDKITSEEFQNQYSTVLKNRQSLAGASITELKAYAQQEYENFWDTQDERTTYSGAMTLGNRALIQGFNSARKDNSNLTGETYWKEHGESIIQLTKDFTEQFYSKWTQTQQKDFNKILSDSYQYGSAEEVYAAMGIEVDQDSSLAKLLKYVFSNNSYGTAATNLLDTYINDDKKTTAERDFARKIRGSGNIETESNSQLEIDLLNQLLSYGEIVTQTNPSGGLTDDDMFSLIENIDQIPETFSKTIISNGFKTVEQIQDSIDVLGKIGADSQYYEDAQGLIEILTTMKDNLAENFALTLTNYAEQMAKDYDTVFDRMTAITSGQSSLEKMSTAIDELNSLVTEDQYKISLSDIIYEDGQYFVDFAKVYKNRQKYLDGVAAKYNAKKEKLNAAIVEFRGGVKEEDLFNPENLELIKSLIGEANYKQYFLNDNGEFSISKAQSHIKEINDAVKTGIDNVDQLEADIDNEMNIAKERIEDTFSSLKSVSGSIDKIFSSPDNIDYSDLEELKKLFIQGEDGTLSQSWIDFQQHLYRDAYGNIFTTMDGLNTLLSSDEFKNLPLSDRNKWRSTIEENAWSNTRTAKLQEVAKNWDNLSGELLGEWATSVGLDYETLMENFVRQGDGTFKHKDNLTLEDFLKREGLAGVGNEYFDKLIGDDIKNTADEYNEVYSAAITSLTQGRQRFEKNSATNKLVASLKDAGFTDLITEEYGYYFIEITKDVAQTLITQIRGDEKLDSSQKTELLTSVNNALKELSLGEVFGTLITNYSAATYDQVDKFAKGLGDALGFNTSVDKLVEYGVLVYNELTGTYEVIANKLEELYRNLNAAGVTGDNKTYNKTLAQIKQLQADTDPKLIFGNFISSSGSITYEMIGEMFTAFSDQLSRRGVKDIDGFVQKYLTNEGGKFSITNENLKELMYDLDITLEEANKIIEKTISERIKTIRSGYGNLTSQIQNGFTDISSMQEIVDEMNNSGFGKKDNTGRIQELKISDLFEYDTTLNKWIYSQEGIIARVRYLKSELKQLQEKDDQEAQKQLDEQFSYLENQVKSNIDILGVLTAKGSTEREEKRVALQKNIDSYNAMMAELYPDISDKLISPDEINRIFGRAEFDGDVVVTFIADRIAAAESVYKKLGKDLSKEDISTIVNFDYQKLIDAKSEMDAQVGDIVSKEAAAIMRAAGYATTEQLGTTDYARITSITASKSKQQWYILQNELYERGLTSLQQLNTALVEAWGEAYQNSSNSSTIINSLSNANSMSVSDFAAFAGLGGKEITEDLMNILTMSGAIKNLGNNQIRIQDWDAVTSILFTSLDNYVDTTSESYIMAHAEFIESQITKARNLGQTLISDLESAQAGDIINVSEMWANMSSELQDAFSKIITDAGSEIKNGLIKVGNNDTLLSSLNSFFVKYGLQTKKEAQANINKLQQKSVEASVVKVINNWNNVSYDILEELAKALNKDITDILKYFNDNGDGSFSGTNLSTFFTQEINGKISENSQIVADALESYWDKIVSSMESIVSSIIGSITAGQQIITITEDNRDFARYLDSLKIAGAKLTDNMTKLIIDFSKMTLEDALSLIDALELPEGKANEYRSQIYSTYKEKTNSSVLSKALSSASDLDFTTVTQLDAIAATASFTKALYYWDANLKTWVLNLDNFNELLTGETSKKLNLDPKVYNDLIIQTNSKLREVSAEAVGRQLLQNSVITEEMISNYVYAGGEDIRQYLNYKNDGNYEIDWSQFGELVKQMGLQTDQVVLDLYKDRIKTITSNISNFSSSAMNGLDGYAEAKEIVDEFNKNFDIKYTDIGIKINDITFKDMFRYDDVLNKWVYTAEGIQYKMLEFREQLKQAGVSGIEAYEILKQSVDSMGKDLDFSGFIKSGYSSDAQSVKARASFLENIKNYNAAVKVIQEYYNSLPSDQQTEEATKKLPKQIEKEDLNKILLGGKEGLEAAQKVYSQLDIELDEDTISSIYNVKANAVLAAKDDMEKSTGEIITSMSAVFLKAAGYIKTKESGIEGYEIITEVHAERMVDAYKTLYYAMNKTAQAAESELNELVLSIWEAEGSQESSLIDIMSNASGMTYRAFGEALISMGQKITPELLNQYINEGIIQDIGGGKIRVKDFQKLSEKLGVNYGSEEYWDAYSKLVDSQIEYEGKARENVTTALKNIQGAQQGDKINIVALTKNFGDSAIDALNNVLKQYSASISNGILTLEDDANIPEVVNYLTNIASQYGIIIEKDVLELAEAVTETLQSFVDAITSGLTQGMKQSDVNSIREAADNLLGGEFFKETDFYKAADGFRITTEAAIRYYNALKQFNDIDTSKLFDQLKTDLIDKNNISTVGDVMVQIKRINQEISNLTNKGAKGEEERLKILNQELEVYRDIASTMQMTDPSSYDFMNQSLPDEIQGPVNYYSSLHTMINTLKASSSSGTMALEEFRNIANTMGAMSESTGQDLIFFGKNYGQGMTAAAALIQEGYSNFKDIDGKGAMVQLKGMGLDLVGGLEGMADNIDTGMHDFAQSQIDMLDGLIAFLETIVAMESLSDIDTDFDGTLGLDELFIKLDEGIYQVNGEAQPIIQKLLDTVDKNEKIKETLQKIKVGEQSIYDVMQAMAAGGTFDEKTAKLYQSIMSGLYQASISGDWSETNIESLLFNFILDADVEIEFSDGTKVKKINGKTYKGTDASIGEAVKKDLEAQLEADLGDRNQTIQIEGKKTTVEIENNKIVFTIDGQKYSGTSVDEIFRNYIEKNRGTLFGTKDNPGILNGAQTQYQQELILGFKVAPSIDFSNNYDANITALGSNISTLIQKAFSSSKLSAEEFTNKMIKDWEDNPEKFKIDYGFQLTESNIEPFRTFMKQYLENYELTPKIGTINAGDIKVEGELHVNLVADSIRDSNGNEITFQSKSGAGSSTRPTVSSATQKFNSWVNGQSANGNASSKYTIDSDADFISTLWAMAGEDDTLHNLITQAFEQVSKDNPNLTSSEQWNKTYEQVAKTLADQYHIDQKTGRIKSNAGISPQTIKGLDKPEIVGSQYGYNKNESETMFNKEFSEQYKTLSYSDAVKEMGRLRNESNYNDLLQMFVNSDSYLNWAKEYDAIDKKGDPKKVKNAEREFTKLFVAYATAYNNFTNKLEEDKQQKQTKTAEENKNKFDDYIKMTGFGSWFFKEFKQGQSTGMGDQFQLWFEKNSTTFADAWKTAFGKETKLTNENLWKWLQGYDNGKASQEEKTLYNSVMNSLMTSFNTWFTPENEAAIKIKTGADDFSGAVNVFKGAVDTFAGKDDNTGTGTGTSTGTGTDTKENPPAENGSGDNNSSEFDSTSKAIKGYFEEQLKNDNSSLGETLDNNQIKDIVSALSLENVKNVESLIQMIYNDSDASRASYRDQFAAKNKTRIAASKINEHLEENPGLISDNGGKPLDEETIKSIQDSIEKKTGIKFDDIDFKGMFKTAYDQRAIPYLRGLAIDKKDQLVKLGDTTTSEGIESLIHDFEQALIEGSKYGPEYNSILKGMISSLRLSKEFTQMDEDRRYNDIISKNLSGMFNDMDLSDENVVQNMLDSLKTNNFNLKGIEGRVESYLQDTVIPEIIKQKIIENNKGAVHDRDDTYGSIYALYGIDDPDKINSILDSAYLEIVRQQSDLAQQFKDQADKAADASEAAKYAEQAKEAAQKAEKAAEQIESTEAKSEAGQLAGQANVNAESAGTRADQLRDREIDAAFSSIKRGNIKFSDILENGIDATFQPFIVGYDEIIQTALKEKLKGYVGEENFLKAGLENYISEMIPKVANLDELMGVITSSSGYGFLSSIFGNDKLRSEISKIYAEEALAKAKGAENIEDTGDAEKAAKDAKEAAERAISAANEAKKYLGENADTPELDQIIRDAESIISEIETKQYMRQANELAAQASNLAQEAMDSGTTPEKAADLLKQAQECAERAEAAAKEAIKASGNNSEVEAEAASMSEGLASTISEADKAVKSKQQKEYDDGVEKAEELYKWVMEDAQEHGILSGWQSSVLGPKWGNIVSEYFDKSGNFKGQLGVSGTAETLKDLIYLYDNYSKERKAQQNAAGAGEDAAGVQEDAGAALSDAAGEEQDAAAAQQDAAEALSGAGEALSNAAVVQQNDGINRNAEEARRATLEAAAADAKKATAIEEKKAAVAAAKGEASPDSNPYYNEAIPYHGSFMDYLSSQLFGDLPFGTAGAQKVKDFKKTLSLQEIGDNESRLKEITTTLSEYENLIKLAYGEYIYNNPAGDITGFVRQLYDKRNNKGNVPTNSEGQPFLNTEIPGLLQTVIEIDEDKALTQISELVEEINTNSGTIPVNADTSKAQSVVSKEITDINRQSATLKIYGEYVPPSGSPNEWGAEGAYGAKGNVALAAGRGQTLMGELGPELVVSNGRYFVVGQNGAEMVDLSPDAIVFNHIQTKRLLENGTAGRGIPVTNERVATSMATGNVSGPAKASAAAVLSNLQAIRALWQSLLNASVKDMATKGGGGGGGGDKTIDPGFIADLERWYNLLRQIERLEQQINYQETLRTKIQSDRIINGKALYQSQKDTLDFLDDEIAKNKELANLQQSYYEKRMKDLEESPFGTIFTFNEEGLMQYRDDLTFDNGDRGGLFALSKLNAQNPNGSTVYTAKEQYQLLKEWGFEEFLKYDSEGKEIKLKEKNKEREEGYTEAVQAFWDKVDAWKDEMDDLYDSYQEQRENVLNNENKRNELLQEIIDNQLSVEQKVVTAIENREQEIIDKLQEERDALDDASNKFIDGLSKQLERERNMYNRNEEAEDLNKLRRQLAILERSGGSASQIKNLQEQIRSKERDTYFNAQQDQIDAIQEASDLEIERLDHQIDIMEETLEYQKENGLFWPEVTMIMKQSPEEIMQFIQEYTPEYQSNSELQISEDLRELKGEVEAWVGYRDDSESPIKADETHHWDNYEKAMKSQFGPVWDENWTIARNLFEQEYARTADPNRADLVADQFLQSKLDEYYELHPELDPNNQMISIDGGSDGSDGKTSYGTLQLIYRYDTQVEVVTKKIAPQTVKGEKYTKPKSGYNLDYISPSVVQVVAGKTVRIYYKYSHFQVAKQVGGTIGGGAQPWVMEKYSAGGLNEYTGLAMLHGTPQDPEAVLNAEETREWKDNIKNTNILLNALGGVQELRSHNPAASIDNSAVESIVIQNASVNMNTTIANDYDAERAGRTALDEMIKIARKSGSANNIRR